MVPSSGKDAYVVGYGSLIDPRERLKAGLPGDAPAVRLYGWRRSWNVKASNKKTYLGVSVEPSAWMNAVLFPVNEDQLSMLDGREWAYDRSEIAASIVSARLDWQARIWLYVPKPEWTRGEASPDFAVKRSYVDSLIEGCLSYGEGFVREFIRTTDLWEQYWFDNRKVPPEARARIDFWVGRLFPASRQVLARLPSG